MARNGFAFADVARATFFLALAATPVRGADCDVAAGGRLFQEQQCAGCHTFAADDLEKSGPNLHGVVGRAAASGPFNFYSDQLKRSGLVWTPEALKKWLTNPSALVPGTSMPFLGLNDDDDRNTLVCYIEQKSR